MRRQLFRMLKKLYLPSHRLKRGTVFRSRASPRVARMPSHAATAAYRRDTGPASLSRTGPVYAVRNRARIESPRRNSRDLAPQPVGPCTPDTIIKPARCPRAAARSEAGVQRGAHRWRPRCGVARPVAGIHSPSKRPGAACGSAAVLTLVRTCCQEWRWRNGVAQAFQICCPDQERLDQAPRIAAFGHEKVAPNLAATDRTSSAHRTASAQWDGPLRHRRAIPD